MRLFSSPLCIEGRLMRRSLLFAGRLRLLRFLRCAVEILPPLTLLGELTPSCFQVKKSRQSAFAETSRPSSAQREHFLFLLFSNQAFWSLAFEVDRRLWTEIGLSFSSEPNFSPVSHDAGRGRARGGWLSAGVFLSFLI